MTLFPSAGLRRPVVGVVGSKVTRLLLAQGQGDSGISDLPSSASVAL